MIWVEAPTLVLALHWTIAAVLIVRILLRRRPRGSAMAWVILTLALPYIGAALYLIAGEVWLPRGRARRVEAMTNTRPDTKAQDGSSWPRVPGVSPDLLRVLGTLAERASGIAMTQGNRLELLDGAESTFESMIRDIDNAESTCFFLTYIWHPEGRTDAIADAILRAADRGVDCRILADAHGSASFFGSAVHHRLLRGGVKVAAANDANWLRLRLARIDLRNHRKITLIDGRIGYTGSLNIVDPARFKTKAHVGQWVDCMVRLEGPAVLDLQLVFLRDWALEHPEAEPQIPTPPAGGSPQEGDAVLQVLPSGPGQAPQVLEQMLLALIYSARKEIIITTPYFVPDDPMMTALASAARGGVRVRLIVPSRIDATLVQLATRSYFHNLMGAGAHVHLFKGGLLHSKTVSIDGTVGLIGTANMDLRSFELNLEVCLIAYNRDCAQRLVALQRRYLDRSEQIDPQTWASRSTARTLVDNIAQLVAPVL